MNKHKNIGKKKSSFERRGPNPDPNSKILDPSKPDPDLDILIFLIWISGSKDIRPRTPDLDKDNKIMDPPDKDSDPDILKLSGYPIRYKPICSTVIDREGN
ncbi:hypothetical protein YC2023_001651 [Brassica napus]